MKTKTETECGMCGEQLTDEERDNPIIRDGDTLCDECFHEHYEFTCSMCENYADIECEHNMLAIYDPEPVRWDYRDAPAFRGIYEIVQFPYYTSNHFNMWLRRDSLRFLAELPLDAEGDGHYPCGHLCEECQAKARQQAENTVRYGDGI